LSYKGEDIEIQSPLGFKNINKHIKLLLSDCWVKSLSEVQQVGPRVRINIVLALRIGSSEKIRRSSKVTKEGAPGAAG
jgi:hypothetical protein